MPAAPCPRIPNVDPMEETVTPWTSEPRRSEQERHRKREADPQPDGRQLEHVPVVVIIGPPKTGQQQKITQYGA